MTTKNIFIIDSRVADYQNLMTGLPSGSQAFVLNPDQDGIAQMQAILANYIAIANSQQPTANWIPSRSFRMARKARSISAIPCSIRKTSTTTAASSAILAAA